MNSDGFPPLCTLSAGASLPYDRSCVTPGIVHLGVGAFHRAHMAVYVDDLLKFDPSWGIIGASLRRPDTRYALAPQDFLYTVVERNASCTSMRIVGSLLDVFDVATQRRELLAAMADPRIRIVSLTVTEKGYCHDPATGHLLPNHPDIRRDLANHDTPISAPGMIVRALELRRAARIAPFAVLSCDNLPSNGETTASVVTQFAALRDKALADFIVREVAFPSTMVDRIVPSTTEEDRILVTESSGLRDAWPVVTEPFSQWVVEDLFPAGRPDFERAGVEMVSDVKPFEIMKLRMLNGSHSSLAYLGYLAGHEFVNEAIAEPVLARFVSELMTQEVMETLPPGVGDLVAYRDALLERFANPALRHRTWQIAMDGSQKLPQRLLGTIRDRLARGQSIKLLSLGISAWMRYATGVDELGDAIDVRDPLAERFEMITASAEGEPGRLVDGFLGLREVFGEDLPRNELFRETLCAHITSLFQCGALETVRQILRG